MLIWHNLNPLRTLRTLLLITLLSPLCRGALRLSGLSRGLSNFSSLPEVIAHSGRPTETTYEGWCKPRRKCPFTPLDRSPLWDEVAGAFSSAARQATECRVWRTV